ncbi:MAG: histidinol-phosphatase HisJ family protein [Lachnospiraceae bacterium]|nr:histidinol-phosphatase HisJ family protein [Lachnospiraceae bacterium]
MKIDIHVHSCYSTDSETKMEDAVYCAVREGIRVLCFTDHIDWDYPVDGLSFDFDVAKYEAEICRLRQQYKGKIDLLMGVELGMQKHLGPRYEKLLKDYAFDFAIGSQHLVDKQDPYYPETFEGKSDEEVFRRYFEELYEDIKAFHAFDSLGHLDYIVRYGKSGSRYYSYRAFADIIDEILKLLVRYNIALECNTCGLRKRLGFPNPHPDVLKRYRELGGTLVTIGSDAHKTRFLGYRFDTALEILKQCGYTHYVYYVKRSPKFVRIR